MRNQCNESNGNHRNDSEMQAYHLIWIILIRHYLQVIIL